MDCEVLESLDNKVKQVQELKDTFWGENSYKPTVKRCEDGLNSLCELTKFFQERAEAEKDYSKKLKSLAKKWSESMEKCSENGVVKDILLAIVKSTDVVATHSHSVSELLGIQLPNKIKSWTTGNYNKSVVGMTKEAKTLEQGFKAIQIPWMRKVNQAMACQKASMALRNLPPKKVLMTKSHLREAREEKRKKYQKSVAELSAFQKLYRKNMFLVFKMAQESEQHRLTFFQTVLRDVSDSIDVTRNQTLIEAFGKLRESNARLDIDSHLRWWSENYGADMPCSWSSFESIVENETENDNSAIVKVNENGKEKLNDDGNTEATTSDIMKEIESESCSDYWSILYQDKAEDCGCYLLVEKNVKALQDYAGHFDDELSFKKGDVFTMIKDFATADGWYYGSKDGVKGFFKQDMVEELADC